MKLIFDWWKVRAGFSFRWMRNQTITGYSGRCQDGQHIIMLDYDDLPKIQVTAEIGALQEMYKLSTFYLFKTTKGYHAVCLDKVPLHELKWIYENTCADRNQWIVPMLCGNKTINLRTSPKDGKGVTYDGSVDTIKPVNRGRDRSGAHARYLAQLGVPVMKHGGLFDQYTKLMTCEYRI